jgi:hypothetical protein
MGQITPFLILYNALFYVSLRYLSPWRTQKPVLPCRFCVMDHRTAHLTGQVWLQALSTVDYVFPGLKSFCYVVPWVRIRVYDTRDCLTSEGGATATLPRVSWCWRSWMESTDSSLVCTGRKDQEASICPEVRSTHAETLDSEHRRVAEPQRRHCSSPKTLV